MDKRRLLVVDDEPNMAWLFEQSFGRHYDVIKAHSGLEALAVLEAGPPDLVLLDLMMPGMDGLTALREIKRRHPNLPVLMMTAYATVKTAVEAIKTGAADYVIKPFDLDEVRRVMEAALPPSPSEQPLRRPQGLLGDSPPMLEVLRKIQRVAQADVSVLILGETGTGKELVARAIHTNSPRAARPFVAVNCAALPENLLESELFGHEKGAFTGAQSRKPGRFELADGGTLLLDEIGDMPLAVQAKLLRVLESRQVEPLGSTRALPVDLRVLAATHRDLPEMVKQGNFREDLYFRLAVVPITLPALRERRGDVGLLAHHLLKGFAERHGKEFLGFSSQALQALESYRWPGNVRELRNLMEQVAVLWDGGQVDLEHLPEYLTAPGREAVAPGQSLKEEVRSLKADYEQERILAALRSVGGNRTQAARLLGISRRALQLKLKELALG
ncbi:MAG: sigma-54-dependent transcriptional regulator [Bacillota bacterium]